MNKTGITMWRGEKNPITALLETGVLEPDPVYPGWTNLVSQRSVRAIAVASQSRHIWLATWGGVLAWDRAEALLYRRYSSEHGLAGNTMTCLCLDLADRPWVGHAEGGLSYFDGHRWQVYPYLQDERPRVLCSAGDCDGVWVAGSDTVYYVAEPTQPPLPIATEHDGAVNALALLAKGDELLLGNAWGLFCLRRRGPEPQQIAAETISTCTALTRDRSGRVWIGTPEGVYHWLKDGHLNGPFAPAEDAPAGQITALAAGRERVWVLTTTGLAQIVQECWIPVPNASEGEEPPVLRAIAASADDAYLWVGTDHLLAGVWSPEPGQTRWDLDLLPLHREDALNNLGHCIASQAVAGRVWIGTAGGLLDCGANDEWTLDPNSGDVHGLCAVDKLRPAKPASQALWMLAWPQGISRQASADRLATSNVQPPGLATMLAVGQDGQPYALTGRGLYRLGSGDPLEIARNAPALVHSMVQMPAGVWWLGTVQGVYRLVVGGWELAGEQPGPQQDEVYRVAVIKGILWAATEAGLWARQGETWVPHVKDPVRALAPAGDSGALWLAGPTGILRYDPATSAKSTPYTPVNSGLASRRVTALLESSGILWIVTQVGISRLVLE